MKLTTTTHVSVDGVMQGLGGSDEDRGLPAQRAPAVRPLKVSLRVDTWVAHPRRKPKSCK
jgi:hypothetical protein